MSAEAETCRLHWFGGRGERVGHDQVIPETKEGRLLSTPERANSPRLDGARAVVLARSKSVDVTDRENRGHHQRNSMPPDTKSPCPSATNYHHI